jgi:hypothetical protein
MRGPGRPPRAAVNGSAPAAKPEPRPEPRPATAQLARLQAQREAGGGFLLPLPPNAAAAGLVQPRIGGGDEPMPNEALKAVLDHFTALHEAGASPADLDLAWESWRPVAVGFANPKLWVRTVAYFDQLKTAAGQRHAELQARAYAEAAPDRIAAEKRRALQAEQAELALIERDRSKVLARIARLEA